MSFNPLTICRLCMKESHHTELYAIDVEDSSLESVIHFCVNVKVQPGDGLPKVICIDCLKKIRIFYNFKRVCLEVDLRFKHLMGNLKFSLDKTNNFIMKEISEPYNNNVTPESSLLKKDQGIHLESSNKINVVVCLNGIDKFNNSFQCERCGRIFKLKTVLEKHMTIHTGIKPYTCKLCPKGFTRAGNRMIHMRSHLGIKPYICEICGRTSTKRQDLIRHMKIHNDERNYSCTLCGRKFKRSFDVNSHMRTHTGLRPYKCNKCGKTYTSQSGLRKHYRNYCKKEPYEINSNS